MTFLFVDLYFIPDSFPYQFLPTREGYVPVYIRLGDTPLNEINPELAVAFHEVAVNGRQLKSNDEVSGYKFLFVHDSNVVFLRKKKLFFIISYNKTM